MSSVGLPAIAVPTPSAGPDAARPARSHTGVSPTHREAGIEDVYETLYERVDKLIGRPHKRPLLSSTGDHAAISELIARNKGLEKAYVRHP